MLIYTAIRCCHNYRYVGMDRRLTIV